jgi:formate-dependent nitrite reductase membrane component NrfD
MSFPATALLISAGIIVWALHFAALYGLTALACARGWDAAVLPALWLATAVAAIAALAIVVAGWRRREAFEHWLSATIGAFGLLAIAYEALTILVVPACV